MGTRKPKGYWSNWDNIIKELNPIIKKLGRFPSQKDLTDLDRRDILNGLSRNQGGLSRVKKEMGYESPIREPNYLKSWENVESELRQVMQELGHFPTQKELRDLGKSSICFAISKYHGGVNAVKEKMSQGPREDKLQSFLSDYAGGNE